MSSALPTSERFVDGDVSFWYRSRGLPARRAPLPGDLDVDVAIVGAGFTGLWTAYYLIQARPDLRIAVLDKEFAGFGASGRNGGWISAESPGRPARYAKAHGRAAAVALQEEMFRTVDEVLAVAEREGIEADVVKSGMLRVAGNPAQLARLRAALPARRRLGWGPADVREVDRAEVRSRIEIADAVGGTFSPHCARVQPAALVRGLADVVERAGVSIYEGTRVRQVRPGVAETDRGRVRAAYVVRALEGFTASLPGLRRAWLPMFSNMIATEPLPAEVWAEIGWHGRELVGVEAHAFAYLQRTADDRIALGGRAVPYRYGSRWDRFGETAGSSVDQLRAMLARYFPAAAGAQIDHAWAGILGVPRDWCASVGLERRTGLAWAGGYVGHGVAATNLAGRTLRDLILGVDSELVRLPWVGRRVRPWEPEPIRFLSVRGLYAAYRWADRLETASGRSRTSAVARAADLLSRT